MVDAIYVQWKRKTGSTGNPWEGELWHEGKDSVYFLNGWWYMIMQMPKSLHSTVCWWEENFHVYPIQLCFITQPNVQGLLGRGGERGAAAPHTACEAREDGARRMGSSGTLRNSRREGTLTPTPLKKVSFTCDWELMPKELTPARPFFTKCLILRNSLSVEWTSVRRH